MDKKYLKEQNLYESHKQFMRLCEGTYFPEELSEDDDTDSQEQGQEEPMGAEEPQGQEDGSQDAMAEDPMAGDESMTDDPMANGGEMDNAPIGGMEDQDMAGGEMPDMGEQPQEEDDVIDVDDLTNAQEDMNSKVNSVGRDLGKVEDKITSLMKAIDSMESMISRNNAEIEAFKQEFEKRNPTQTEKLNLRSLKSYPYNVNIDDFWKDKTANSNYDVYSNNSERPDDERSLEITNNDVDDFNEREIADSFSINDDLQQTIEKIFA